LPIQPSTSDTIRNGFASITRFFPGARDVLADIDDKLVDQVLGQPQTGNSLTFEDQYASTGGQLHCLASGADRFLADLRPLMKQVVDQRNQKLGHCCHPYDICTALIATEVGVAITGPDGQTLDVPLDVETNVAWVGYANQNIRQQVEPVLQQILKSQGLI